VDQCGVFLPFPGPTQLHLARPEVPCGQLRIASVPGRVQLHDRALMFLGGHIDKGDTVPLWGDTEGEMLFLTLSCIGGSVLSMIFTLSLLLLSEV